MSTDLTWTAVARASSGAATAASLPPERDQRHAASDAPQRAADAKPATAKTPSAGSAQPAAPRSKTAAKPADDAPVARSPKIPPKPGAPRRTAAWRPSPEFVERWLPFYEAAHADAELSGAEHATTERIEAALDDLGIEHVRVSDTGTVAVIRNGDGPVIAFRADIDGLPVTEATGLAYASARTAELDGRSVGTMHACGHDTHFTSALAAAQHFAANLDAWAGTLVIVFQPAEETAAGAAAMLAGGLWDRVPKPQIVLGQHVMPLPAGVVALRSGDLMSLADTLRVTVRGRQAHGSQPEASVDPVVAAASAVVRLQTVVARETAPGAGVVVTVGTFHAGTAANVIPATAEFTVNVRTPDERTRQATLDAVHRIVRAEADASRAEVEIEAVTSFPRCVNDDAHTARVTGLLVKAFGAKHVLSLDRPLTGSEDVGALADAIGVPLVYWFFGGFPEGAFADGATPPGNHSSHFAPDGRLALATGITGAVNVLRAYLQRRG